MNHPLLTAIFNLILRRVEIYFPYKVDNRFVVIYGCNVRICTYAARACYYCSHDAESFCWTTRPPHTISMLRAVETFMFIIASKYIYYAYGISYRKLKDAYESKTYELMKF